jgi:predicted RNA binding protein YcfA (HicA-like mRNA interferase family)
MKVRDVLKRLNDEGWYLDRTEGSHRQFRHADKPGARVTIAGRPSTEIPLDTLKSIYRQAGWSKRP